MKNIKRMFFVLTLVTLLAAVGAVCAADDTNSTGVTDNSVSDVASVSDSTSDTIAAEPATTSNDNKVDTKTIEKEDKNLKTSAKIVDVNNYNGLITAMRNAVKDSENDTYVINLNEGSYEFTTTTMINAGTYQPNIIINGNNQTLTAKRNNLIFNLRNNCNITLNNINLNHDINQYTNLSLVNSTLNASINNLGTLIISDDTIFAENAAFRGSGEFIISDYNRVLAITTIYFGNITLENFIINSPKENRGYLIIKNSFINNTLTNNYVDWSTTDSYSVTIMNSTINSTINNGNLLILCDDVVFDEGFSITRSGSIITNATNEKYVFFNQFTGGTLSNLTIDKKLTTTDVTFINCNFTKGNHYLRNSTIIDSRINSPMGAGLDCLTITGDSIINSTISNEGTLIIGDNVEFGENFNLSESSQGIIIINDTNKIAPYINSYTGDMSLINKTITGNKSNNGNLSIVNSSLEGTLVNQGNCTITNSVVNSNITNNGKLTLENSTIKDNIVNNGIIEIDDSTIFEDGVMITGYGKIIINNLEKLLSHLSTIYGNHTLRNIVLNDSYNFIGNISLDNCTIQSIDNVNYGLLKICNSTLNITEESNWIENNGVILINDSESITEESIDNYGDIYYGLLPDNYNPKVHIVNNNSLEIYFYSIYGNKNFGKLTDIVNPGDILDFRGTISRPDEEYITICINKPVNIITSTHDGKIDNFTSFTYEKESSYSNVTGLTVFNTQFYVIEATDIMFDNISNIVDDKRVGWGVGQTSIRGSNNITVKNSYIYTRNNGGSSSLVLAISNYCTFLNDTIVGEGNCGNLVYFTTYNAEIPEDGYVNHHNKVLNCTIRGEGSAISVGYVVAGSNNIFDGCNMYIPTAGAGATVQWGSGTDEGTASSESFITGNNTISNSNFYGGCGASGADYVYNNYIELGTLTLSNSIAYNNTAINITLKEGNIQLYNNTIKDTLKMDINLKSANVTDNIIKNAEIRKNIIFKGNNITGLVNIYASNNTIQNNSIINNYNYTINGTGLNNTITDNYLLSTTSYGDNSINLNNEKNIIKNNLPKLELIINPINTKINNNITISANIYFDNQILTDINTGKVAFKVNGKTLKDENGKVIYAKVVNGVATIENYLVPDDWAKDDSTIQAVYSGSTQCEKLTSEKTNITVATPEATLTITPITSDVQAGSTVTLKAKIAAGDKAITTGKIVFKVNGKTVKDANGKVIYAKVDSNGEVSVDYTIPESFKAGTYNIEAVFTASGYEKLTGNTTMTVVKS